MKRLLFSKLFFISLLTIFSRDIKASSADQQMQGIFEEEQPTKVLHKVKASRSKQSLNSNSEKNKKRKSKSSTSEVPHSQKNQKSKKKANSKLPSQLPSNQLQILDFFKPSMELAATTNVSMALSLDEEEMVFSDKEPTSSMEQPAILEESMPPPLDEEELILIDVEPTSSINYSRLRKGEKRDETAPENIWEKSTRASADPNNLPTIPYSRQKVIAKDDSDNEDMDTEDEGFYVENKFPEFPAKIVPMGTQLKLLANAYLRNLDQTANIFLPYYILKDQSGTCTVQDFFRTPKREICVFASGGFQNVWEKTVSKVYEIFFGDKVKIIRTSWIRKHLYKDKDIIRDLEEEFQGREQELHSEFYYDLFFQHFFLPDFMATKRKDPSIFHSLTIYGFSWWDVCDKCERYLTNHRYLLSSKGMNVFYKVASTRRYQHYYSRASAITEARVPPEEEVNAWNKIWDSVKRYVHKDFENEEQKEYFWTRTKEGLEICKWLGQAFVENKVSLNGRKKKPGKRGDILKYYETITGDEETKHLETLLAYLREYNWELSCWYKKPYPDEVQGRWKKYWRQLVIPHFGWEELQEVELEDGITDHCQMCGYPELQRVFWVFHPKFRVSESFFNLPIEEQRLSEILLGYNSRTPLDELPFALQKKRKQSLWVGSECVKVLGLSHNELEEWREEHPDDARDAKWDELAKREEDIEALDLAEKELAKNKRHLTKDR